MSLKRNIFANYLSQIYVTAISIVIVPLYIRYMGTEAYGLVGFFAMLQAWFNLLDMGLGSTLARETARFRGGAVELIHFRCLVRALENIFLLIALLGAIAVFMSASYIAKDWLQSSHLPISEIINAVRLMALIIASRWLSGLYRGIITGSEQLIWLGNYNALIATLRFGGVLIVLNFIGTTVTLFFAYQLIIALIELFIIVIKAYQLIPSLPKNTVLAWSLAPIKPLLKFSLSIALLSLIWALATQTDKLILSKMLSLADYGYFTLAVLVASGITIVSTPVSNVIMPRMATLEAENNHDALIRVYRQTTQLVSIVASAVAVTMVFYAEPLLWAWTGDMNLARQAAPILKLYAAGNAILAVSAFPYYLQYAKGDLKLHLIGNILLITLLIPAIIWSVSQYGVLGAGYTWVIVNATYFILWIPLVHFRFEKKLHLRWFLFDVLIIFFIGTLTGYSLLIITPVTANRWWQLAIIGTVGLLVMMSGILSSSLFWKKFNSWLNYTKITN